MTGMRATMALLLALGCTSLSGARAASAAPGQPHLNNIVQRAHSAGAFGTFAALIERADLADTLSGRGPYTVFAPTDAAFAKLPAATLTALAADKSKLREVLLYHVVRGSVPASELVTRRGEKTLDRGRSVRIAVSGTTVTVGGGKVVAPERQTANGIFYAVDKVLIPPS
jgi:uncharacterized surface protein with fasciclin (FAS1) repeats